MLFIDCSGWCEKHGQTIEEVEQACWRVGAAVQDGAMFRGRCHLRMNLALPLSRVREAFDRLEKFVFQQESLSPESLDCSRVFKYNGEKQEKP